MGDGKRARLGRYLKRVSKLRATVAIAGAVVVAAVVVGMIARASESDEPGYRLRADTMLPADLSIRPEDVDCPEHQGQSPIEYVETGALANSLPVYEGDLIAVRVRAIADRPSSIVEFTASWPTEVIGETQPSCVFVVGDGSNPSQLTWEENGPASTAVAMTDVPSDRNTEVEFWLWVDDPEPGSPFRTTLETPRSTDDIVLNPAEGQVGIGRRQTSTPEVALATERVEGSGRRVEVRATVTNPTAKSRALDVELRLNAPDGKWIVAGDNDDSERECRGGRSLVCPLGDLGDSDVIEMTAILELEESWEPSAVACGSSSEDTGYGLCINARAVSLRRADQASSRATTLAPMPRPTAGDLTVKTSPDPVVARFGQPFAFAFTISSAGQDDLGSVTVIGSDCETIERVEQPLDNGDAFLEPGETWRYACTTELRTPTPFRFDVSAVDPRGRPVTASYEAVVRVIEPELEITAVADSARPTVRVTNTGHGTIRNVALYAPGCTVIGVVNDESVEILDEGRSIDFACESGDGDLTAAVAYGTDELELGVVGEWQ